MRREAFFKKAALPVCVALALSFGVVGCSPTESDPQSVTEIDYANVNFDYTDQLAKDMKAVTLVPQAADIDIAISDANNTTGLVLTPASDKKDKDDYYLNTFVAGDQLQLTAQNGNQIASVASSVSGDITVSDGAATLALAPLDATGKDAEVFTVGMKDGSTYKIHALNEQLPNIEIGGTGITPDNAGVYSMAIDKFLLRVSTDGKIVYYRNLNCNTIGESIANFCKQETPDGNFYTYFSKLNADLSGFGYCSGMYVVMDENYNEIERVNLAANADENHTHGPGYLDEHEFVMLGKDHYLALSYTEQRVTNLPEDVKGAEDGKTAYVWAGIIQEIKDGAVVGEICTTDYPLFYSTAVEGLNFAESTDKGVTTNLKGFDEFSIAAGYMDYVHVNSLDYTLNDDGSVDKLLVSMRNQCAIYQFDFNTGALEWIMGGKGSTLTGYEDIATPRADAAGNEFSALTYAQHYARYTNRDANGKIEGNPSVSVFDNHCGVAPFLAGGDPPTLTRTFIADIDAKAGTVSIHDLINSMDLNKLTGKYHLSSHCGSVTYAAAPSSVVIGWGGHFSGLNGPDVPFGSMADPANGFDDLRQGSCPVVSDYDMQNDQITFELSMTRSEKLDSHEMLYSYRTYKNAE